MDLDHILSMCFHGFCLLEGWDDSTLKAAREKSRIILDKRRPLFGGLHISSTRCKKKIRWFWFKVISGQTSIFTPLPLNAPLIIICTHFLPKLTRSYPRGQSKQIDSWISLFANLATKTLGIDQAAWARTNSVFFIKLAKN